MKLEELRVYEISMKLGELVWEEVSHWKYFERDTLGKQWVRAADSIAANISEGYGRYHFKENKHFLYYARGSYNETRTWFAKAVSRGLVSEENTAVLRDILDDFSPRLNNYIRSICPNPSQVREPQSPYGDSDFFEPTLNDTPDTNHPDATKPMTARSAP